MSRIIVKFKERICFDVQTEHAVVDICNLFGYCTPWFNDDTWLEDDSTLIIGQGYKYDKVDENIAIILQKYGPQIKEIYEEKEADE